MTNDADYVGFTQMADGTAADYALLAEKEAAFHAGHVDRVLDHLRLLDVDWGGYRVTRYEHSLQTATRALRDDAGEEMVVAALLHDIGDLLAPENHSQLAAALLRPYVGERTHWVVRHHGLFQGYYYAHFEGGDPHARERYRDHPHFDACVHFCHAYDQAAFDPAYDTLPLEVFEPMVRRLFASPRRPGTPRPETT